MKITQECDYAIRIILFLSRKEKGYKAGAKEISEKQSIPLRFAVKILRKLILAKLLISYKGANGGYALFKQPEDISLLKLVEIVDGPITVNKCLAENDGCNMGAESNCSVHVKLGELRDVIRQKLGEINFGSLSEDSIR